VDKVGVWYTYPTRAACGACHAEINWVTGAGHSDQNIPQANDTACATCHPQKGTQEYDTSVQGAHIVPSDSTQLKGINITLVSATNVGPGKKPILKFTVKDNKGANIPLSSFSSASVTIDGNTIDYAAAVTSESVLADTADATGVFTHNFTYTIPASAKGTWTFSAQMRRTVVLTKAVGGTISFTEGAMNPILDVSVDGSVLKHRRTVVTLAKCNACHDRLANLFSHGGQRIAIEYCVQCHSPNVTDAARRPADGSANPPEGVSFAHMIHRIHTGEELATNFSIYGNAGTPNNFNEVVYPGDRRNCIRCHATVASFSPPIQAGALNVLTPRDAFSPQGPATAACLGCHDAEDFAAHAYINTAVFPSGTVAEACAACHGANSELSPATVHAR
jgi:OmcA/MtrC family decaheme c-type cytochrome